MKKICMLVTNSVLNDPRVRREAATLAEAGYQVVVMGITGAGHREEEWIEGYRVIRVPQPHPLIDRLKKLAPVYRVAKRMYRKCIDRKAGSDSSNDARPEDASWNAEPRTGKSWRHDWREIISIFFLNLAFAREGRTVKADVYHVHNLDTLLAGVLVAKRTHAKLVYDFHELYTEQFAVGQRTWLWRIYYRTLERWLVTQPQALLTVCDSLGEWVARQYGVTKAMTVRNVPMLRLDSSLPKPIEREPVILYHGAFCAHRGLEQLVMSAKFLERGRIVLRGLGDLEPTLRRLVREQQVGERVEFAPPLPVGELIAAARQADIGVLPFPPACLNTRYCLPNKLFEYMMAGLAIVSTDLPEIRRVVMDHHVGLLVQSIEPKDLACTLNGLLNDRVTLERMKRSALQAAQVVYNWEHERARLLKLYESVVPEAEVA